MACSMETSNVDLVLLKVSAKRMPPKNVSTMTKAFLKNIWPSENTMALRKRNSFSLENNA
jgi:hypothetical protein